MTFIVLRAGFIFLRDSDAPKLVIALVAIIWGVGGVGLLFFVTNWLIELLPSVWTRRLQPFLFVGPAMAVLAWFLAIPTVRTFWLSLVRPHQPGICWLGELYQGVHRQEYA